MMKTQDKSINLLTTKGTFIIKQKIFFIIFKGISVARNFLEHNSGPLI